MSKRPHPNETGHKNSKRVLHFPPCRPVNFQGPFPFFRQPKEIGSFSQDDFRKFQHDKSQQKYYCPPSDSENVHFDLRVGYKQCIRRDENVKEYLDDLLRWINHNKQKFMLAANDKNSSKNLESLNTDFISWRGLLTRVLCSPYENRDGWIIAATLYKGTIYLCEFDTPEKIHQRENCDERQKEMTYWGYKFEQYVTSDEPGGHARTDRPVNNNAAFASVARGRLAKYSLVFGGEVDCCESAERPSVYLEMKTSREIDNPRQLNNMKKFKMIKWWAQSFLIGIEKIVVGFRDDEGVVRRLQTYKTMDIPNYCRDLYSPWEPSVCFNFLDQFLDLVKRTAVTDDPRSVCVFTHKPGCDLTWQTQPVGSSYQFLPEWYYNEDVKDSQTLGQQPR